MTSAELTDFIRRQAIELGFEACGFAQAGPVSESHRLFYENWLQNQFQGEMHYMERNQEKRFDPTLLVENCQSVVAVALNYYPAAQRPENLPRIARYALADDYHGIVRNKLRLLLQKINDQGDPVKGRAFCDSAPVLERYWAQQAGLGWIGKNKLLIIPGLGSYVFIGILLIDAALEYDQPMQNRCGTCNKCFSACPTTALGENGLDARRCLSYLTIEKRGDFTDEEAHFLQPNNQFFGCDLCQESCPWNRFAQPNKHPELTPRADILSLDPNRFLLLNSDNTQQLLKNSCLERSGIEGLRRNAQVLKK